MEPIIADPALETCPDCQLKLPSVASPKHSYLGASSSCWALYNEVLAREYSSPALMKSVHRLTVDAYAAQHPGTPARKTIQSAWVHLAGLYLTVERGRANEFATRVIGALAAKAELLEWLAPPANLGMITVLDIANTRGAPEHEEAVRLWARDVWEAWNPYHLEVKATIARLIET